MTTSSPNHHDEPSQSPRSPRETRSPFSIPSSRRPPKSPSPSLYTSPHRSSNPTTPSRLTSYRPILTPHRTTTTPHRTTTTPHRTTTTPHRTTTTPHRTTTTPHRTTTTPSRISTTPSGRRNETPDLRNTLRRRYTTLDYRPHTGSIAAGTTTSTGSPSALTRRTQSLANLDSKRNRVAKEEEPWTREHWLLLSSYYEDMNRDLNGTTEVFYRHESLCSVETETGRKVIIELWPPYKIKRQVKCLEIAANRHRGMPLQDRIAAFEERNRKRVRSELEADLMDDPNEAVPLLKKTKKTTTDE